MAEIKKVDDEHVSKTETKTDEVIWSKEQIEAMISSHQRDIKNLQDMLKLLE